MALNRPLVVGSSTPIQVKEGITTLHGIHITTLDAGGTIEFRNGNAGQSDTVFTIDADHQQNIDNLSIRFGKGLRVVIVGTTARYLIIFS